MNTDFSRILTLLRKEKGISQKLAAAELNISQALLSHYEKGIRECGLDFVIRAADFYGVSCDYLLGRSPERTGATLSVEDIPDEDENIKDNMYRGSVLPVLNKKLIANSLNILFDLLQKAKNKALTAEVSSFLMLSVYRMFRIVYNANPKNQQSLFTLPKSVANAQAAAQMTLNEANVAVIVSGENMKGTDTLKNTDELYMTTDSISGDYPQMASSLFNLIQNSDFILRKNNHPPSIPADDCFFRAGKTLTCYYSKIYGVPREIGGLSIADNSCIPIFFPNRTASFTADVSPVNAIITSLE